MKPNSSYKRLLAKLLILPSLLMLTMLGGCQTLSSSAPTLSPKLAVDLPNDCESLAVEVPVPGVTDAKGRPMMRRVVLRRTQAALLLANDTLAQVRECLADQRSAYQSK